jgi:hypothetical protein
MEDAQSHNTYQDQLHCEIKTLKQTIQSMEEKAARTKQEHLNELNNLNVKHGQREAEHQKIVSKLMSDWEAMRL